MARWVWHTAVDGMEFQERRGYEMGVSLGGVAKNGQIGMRCSFGRLEWATK